jgi:glycerol-3-phosphate dehydrogenase
MAGFRIPIKPNKGTMGVYNMRPTKTLIGILRTPSDGDGLVSMGYQNTSLLGTSSVDIEDPDAAVPGLDEIELMEHSVEEILPDIRKARMIRMCTGVRPLYSTTSETGRAVSRRMILIDHEEEHGISGIITITGGKYATARLMAEETVDLACRKLGSDAKCTSDIELIYGAQTKEEAEKDAKYISEKYRIPLYTAHKFTARYGSRGREIIEDAPEYSGVICECAQVIGSEVFNAFRNEEVLNFNDLRRRIRTGMGTCQGTFCTYKVAALYQKAVDSTASQAHDQTAEYMQERWKGIYYTLQYGDQLAQAEIMQSFYVNLGGYDFLDTKVMEVVPHE